jgi:hypothetical protein
MRCHVFTVRALESERVAGRAVPVILRSCLGSNDLHGSFGANPSRDNHPLSAHANCIQQETSRSSSLQPFSEIIPSDPAFLAHRRVNRGSCHPGRFLFNLISMKDLPMMLGSEVIHELGILLDESGDQQT